MAVSVALSDNAQPSGDARPEGRRTVVRNVLVAGGIAAIFLVAVLVIFQFVGGERDREVAQWRARLSIVADSRLEAVSTWLRRERRSFAQLAENQTLPIYVGAVRQASPNDPPPEAQFLRNLLRATAARAGYGAGVTGNVPAKVTRQRPAGLAIIDPAGKPIVATRGMPQLSQPFRSFVRGLSKPGVHMFDLHLRTGARGATHVMIGFAAVVAGVGDRPVAYVVGLKPAGAQLYALLKQPGATGGTAEAYLVRPRPGTVEFISPLRNGAKPFALRLSRTTADLVAAAALVSPAGFLRGKDYKGQDVLAVSRKVPNTDWRLIYKIDEDDALADNDARLSRLLIMLLLALALVIAAILAVWRHGASRRAATRATAYREVAEELEQQRNLLRVVTENQPDAIYIVSDQDEYRFANSAAAAGTGMPPGDLDGKALTSVLGPQRARRIERLNRMAVEKGERIVDMARNAGQEGDRVVQSTHVPLPVGGDLERSVLVVEEDVTDVITERERRERNLHSLVEALVTVVDRRDPNAAHHSVQVATVARAIATEMGLEERLVETAGIAGDLMNIGKLMVPSDLLTKPDKLNSEEFAAVRTALDSGPELLAGIEFDGPVVDTLRQAQERWDGSGRPKGLKADDILVTARIIAVANAFVALASPRAHRPAQSIDGALQALQGAAGKDYDRRVVAALANYLDNRGGRDKWSDLVAAASR